MVLKFVLLVTLAAVALARRAPHADYVETLLKNNPESRYSNDIEEDASLDVVSVVMSRKYHGF